MFKKIEIYEKIKKGIIASTVALVIIDTIIAFISPVYLPSASSLIGLGFASYYLIKEYAGYHIDHRKVSKVILTLSLILAIFSVYHILLNLLNMAGAFA